MKMSPSSCSPRDTIRHDQNESNERFIYLLSQYGSQSSLSQTPGINCLAKVIVFPLLQVDDPCRFSF